MLYTCKCKYIFAYKYTFHMYSYSLICCIDNLCALVFTVKLISKIYNRITHPQIFYENTWRATLSDNYGE